MVEKGDLNLDTCILYAVSLKNILSSIDDFTPDQIVFGRDPNVPDVSTDSLSALESTNPSDALVQHLHLMVLKRVEDAYLYAQSSQSENCSTKNVRNANFIPQFGD